MHQNGTATNSITTTIEKINNVVGNTANENGIYTWKQKNGQNASTTGTIYGIYDMSGGTWEVTSAIISNGNICLLDRGQSLLDEAKVTYTIIDNTESVTADTGTSTKYVTIYPYSKPESTTQNIANQKNFANNIKIYGDAIRETAISDAGTSNDNWKNSSWNSDYSYFPALNFPFFKRGGYWWSSYNTGVWAFSVNNAPSGFLNGFRAVLINK